MPFEFEQQNPSSSRIPGQKKSTAIGWLMRKGIVKSEKQAEYLILIFCLISFILMAYIFAASIFGFQLAWWLNKDMPDIETARKERVEQLKEQAKRLYQQ